MDINNLQFRFLKEEEFSRREIIEIFEKENLEAPKFPIANILVAENLERQIVALSIAQPIFHINEPTWIHPDYRNTLLVLKLTRKLIEAYSEFKGLITYTFSPNDKVSSILKRLGYTELTMKIFKKVLN